MAGANPHGLAVATGRSQMARRVESARVLKAIARCADAPMTHRLCINRSNRNPRQIFANRPSNCCSAMSEP
jgi:hypothetical protein